MNDIIAMSDSPVQLARQCRAVTFFVRSLASQVLSPNGNHRSGFAISEAKGALGESAYHDCLNALGPDVPHLTTPVDVLVDGYICYRKRPKDGMYRPTDPSNLGGDVSKPILDYGLVKNEVIPNDTYREIRYFLTHITPVETLEEEGFAVTVTEVEV